MVVAANGGSDLVYLPGSADKDRSLAGRVVDLLLKQDYVSGLFVDDSLGRFPGTLPLSAINLKGMALTPHPAIVVNFRSFASGCDQPIMCAVTVADTPLQQGQGMHGSFNRADTMNFMAAAGPSFQRGFADETPVSNADIGRTMAHILGLTAHDKGTLIGRVAQEALQGGQVPESTKAIVRSAPGPDGLITVLMTQRVENTTSFTAAGFPGRTVGVDERKADNR